MEISVKKINHDLVIKKNEITFVVCGKIVLNGSLRTECVLTSIRDYFPQSKIILSTWEGQQINTIKSLCDEVVLSDPSKYPVRYRSHLNQKRLNTVNVQQITAFSGLSKVTTSWAVKTRTDFVLKGDDFFKFYLFWEPILRKIDPCYKIFNRRILAPWIFTKNPEQTAVVYQLSDFFQFGTTEDLIKLWDGHQESDEVLNYFSEHPDNTYSNPEQYNHLYNPEQCLFINTIKKSRIPVDLPRWYCDKHVMKSLPEIKKVYASNILLATLYELQLKTRWEKEEPIYRKETFISFQQLISWYIEQIDSENQVCRNYLEIHPNPSLGKWHLSRKIRMMLREIPFFRNMYQTFFKSEK